MNNINDIKTVEDRFIRSLGSGRGALAWLLEIAESVAVSRDTTVFKRAYFRAFKVGDTQGAQAVKFVVTQMFDGAEAKLKDEKTASIKISGCDVNQEALNGLRAAVESKLSIRGPAWRKLVKPEDESKRPEITCEVANKLVASQVKSKKLTRAELLALAAAYQEAAKKMVAAIKSEAA